MNAATLLLRLQLMVRRAGPLACAGALGLLLAGAALAWLLPQRSNQAAQFKAALAKASAPQPQATVQAATPDQNLAAFYDALGEKRFAEQQVKALFGLAAKAGLTLSQGDYKSETDISGKFSTYQVTLPVKGSYGAIWQFALSVLASMPFAALDEIAFRRETIGEPVLEARLRLTFYLVNGGQP